MTNCSWIRELILKARVLLYTLFGTCSEWGLLRAMKTFLGIMTRVSSTSVSFP